MSLIYLYKDGLDKIDDLPSDIAEGLEKLRKAEIENMMELQFILSYLGNISKTDTDEMTPFELHNWFRLLKKQKATEAEKDKA